MTTRGKETGVRPQEFWRGMEQHVWLERRDRRELPTRCGDSVNASRFRELIRANDDRAVGAPVAAQNLTLHIGDGVDLPAGQAHPPKLLPATKAMLSPSGDQTGGDVARAPSVPTIGRTAAVASDRTHSDCVPVDPVVMNASVDPSGESARLSSAAIRGMVRSS